MSISGSRMPVYIGIYLAGVKFKLNFDIFIVNEIYGRKRRMGPGRVQKKLAQIREFLRNMRELVTVATEQVPYDLFLFCKKRYK